MNPFEKLGIVFMFIAVMPKEHSPGWLSSVFLLLGTLLFIWSDAIVEMKRGRKESTEREDWDVQL